ncbi:hypothetical protein F8388_010376 [Cannabis sativa]|uniref:Uncharacterized protein n=1 Tax=Cannabis sativa TaxID=3483 RepID=A0A7J6GTW9_CANSA|nr:hypothetical protein F8388_010376 [Cannabis sativa]
MKREGRQHGMVRTLRILPSPLNPRPETRFVNRFDSPATAGLFTRVSTKPTGHSNSRASAGSHVATGATCIPRGKAKDKTKGNMKLKSNDVVSNHRLLTWRVVDGRTGLNNVSGFSATQILDQLSNFHEEDDDDEEEEEKYDDDDEKEERMSFCDVGFVLEQEEDDGWCLVGEM